MTHRPLTLDWDTSKYLSGDIYLDCRGIYGAIAGSGSGDWHEYDESAYNIKKA